MDTSPIPQSPIPTPEPVKYRQLPWLAFVLSLLVLSIIAALAFQNFILRKQLSLITPPPVSEPSISPIPSISPNPTTDWKTYKNEDMRFLLKYPNYLDISEETTNSITLVSSAITDKTTSKKPIYYTNKPNEFAVYNDLPTCSPDPVEKLNDESSCVSESGIKDFSLNNVAAKTFILGNYQIVQTTTNPYFEIKADITGGGAAQTFDQILSTFRFTK